MSKIFIFYAFIIATSGFLILDRVWFGFLPEDIFLKIMVTLLIIGGGVLAIDMIRKEFYSEKELKKDKYID